MVKDNPVATFIKVSHSVSQSGLHGVTTESAVTCNTHKRISARQNLHN